MQSIEEEEEQSFFLGSVFTNNQAWTADIQVRDTKMTFKLETGADVTAIADTDLDKLFSKAEMPVLQQPEKPLLGPGRTSLDVTGFTKLMYGTKQTTEKVYVVKNLSTPLLRRPVITNFSACWCHFNGHSEDFLPKSVQWSWWSTTSVPHKAQTTTLYHTLWKLPGEFQYLWWGKWMRNFKGWKSLES